MSLRSNLSYTPVWEVGKLSYPKIDSEKEKQLQGADNFAIWFIWGPLVLCALWAADGLWGVCKSNKARVHPEQAMRRRNLLAC